MASELWGNDNGNARRLRELWVNDNGVARRLTSLWANDNGTPRQIFVGIEITSPLTLQGIAGESSGYCRFTPNGAITLGSFASGGGGLTEIGLGNWILDLTQVSQIEIRATILSAPAGIVFSGPSAYGVFLPLSQAQQFGCGINPAAGNGTQGTVRYDFRAGGSILSASTQTHFLFTGGF